MSNIRFYARVIWYTPMIVLTVLLGVAPAYREMLSGRLVVAEAGKREKSSDDERGPRPEPYQIKSRPGKP